MLIITAASLDHALKATTLVPSGGWLWSKAPAWLTSHFSISTISQDAWKCGFSASLASRCLIFTNSKVLPKHIFPFSFIHSSIHSFSLSDLLWLYYAPVICRGLYRPPHLIQSSQLSCRYCHLCFQEQKLGVRGLAASPRWWSWGTNSDLPKSKLPVSGPVRTVIYSLRKESWGRHLPVWLCICLATLPASSFLRLLHPSRS